MIGDPAMDMAWTDFLIDIPLKIIFPDLDPGQVRDIYLDAYRRTRPLDEANTDVKMKNWPLIFC